MSDLPVLPVGLQSLTELREADAVYVDKTRQLCYMIAHSPKFSFIGRPRRFGKSLMLSTLRELYLGNKGLFAGTWAFDNYDFAQFPVLYIDFAKVDTDSNYFADELLDYLHKLAAVHDIALRPSRSPGNILGQLIEGLAVHGRVVVLIDEYDRPLIDHINDGSFDAIAGVVKNFYIQLKANSHLIRQCVMTGITEFGKLSIFSGANQFSNLSLYSEYSTLFGYTRSELEENFAAHIEYAQQVTGLDATKWWEKLRYQYNGYSWDVDNLRKEDNRVYCPFTVLRYFENPSRFANHWAQSGTTSLLVEIMKFGKIDTIDVEHTVSEIDQIMSLDSTAIDTVGLLFQTGYLTLTDDDSDDPLLIPLGFPNQEIKTSLNKLILAHAAGSNTVTKASLLRSAVKNEDWPAFITGINQIMAGISYEIFHKKEHYVHSIIHTILSAGSMDVASQVHTNTGRIDIVISYVDVHGTPKHAVIELKTSSVNPGKTDDDLAADRKLAHAALEQIRANNYCAAYTNPVALGIVVNTNSRQITAWVQ